jgi:predicted nucleic acid-binding protein
MNLVDSSGWLEYITNGNQARIFTPIIQNYDELIVSVINKYEVYKKLCLEFNPKKASNTMGVLYYGRLVEVTEEIALTAAELSIEYHIPMADSLLLATAKTMDATFWTLDAHFKNIPGVKYFEKE